MGEKDLKLTSEQGGAKVGAAVGRRGEGTQAGRLCRMGLGMGHFEGSGWMGRETREAACEKRRRPESQVVGSGEVE